MRYVETKDVEQQDVHALHRLRSFAIKTRTGLVNQIRGLMGKYGIVLGQGISQVRRRVPEILEDGENGLTDPFRTWLANVYEELHQRCPDRDV